MTAQEKVESIVLECETKREAMNEQLDQLRSDRDNCQHDISKVIFDQEIHRIQEKKERIQSIARTLTEDNDLSSRDIGIGFAIVLQILKGDAKSFSTNDGRF